MVSTNSTDLCDDFIYLFASPEKLLDCSWGTPYLPLFLLCIYTTVLFLILKLAADEYLCPAVVTISKFLGLSESVAGVTLVAFGNGAPDVFSAVSGIETDKSSMVFSQLYGSGLCVSALVVGVVMIVVPPFTMDWKLSSRDISFYVGASIFTFYVYCQSQVTLVQSIAFIVLYVVYIVIVAMSPFGSKQSHTTPNPEEQPIIHSRDVEANTPSSGYGSIISEPKTPSGMWKEFTEMSCLAKLKALLFIPLSLSIPVVDAEKPENNWCKALCTLQCVLTPTTIILLFGGGYSVRGVPLCVLVLPFSLVSAIIVYWRSTSNQAPKFHIVFALMGFAASIGWISRSCDLLVDTLSVIGSTLGISESIMGLTVLSWGNSLGDLATNIAIARHGYASMAISAAFGGILLDMLLGLGIPCSVHLLSTPNGTIELDWNYAVMVLFVGAMCFFAIAYASLWWSRWRASRIQGFGFILVYLSTVVAAVVTSTLEPER